MFFKVLPDDNENKEKIKPPIEKDNNIFLQYISELGIEKIQKNYSFKKIFVDLKQTAFIL